MTKKEQFIEYIDKNKKIVNGCGVLVVKIIAPGMIEPEYIVNTGDNVASKLEYYKKAYDDDLCLIANKDIRMIGYKLDFDLNLNQTIFQLNKFMKGA